LKEWKSGKRQIGQKKDGFTEKTWKATYDAHLKDMECWDALVPAVTAGVRKKFYERAKYVYPSYFVYCVFTVF
jgi:hypothetical protein